jgi:AraC-like DNA-binding protein
MARPTIGMRLARTVTRGAVARGIALEPLMWAAGIAPGLLSDDRARLTTEQYGALVKQLIRATDDEFLGLAPWRCPRGTLLTMGRLVVHCTDLEHAIRDASDFYALFAVGHRLEVTREGATAIVSMRPVADDDPDHFLTVSVLTIWHRFSSWLIGRQVPLARITLPLPVSAMRPDYMAVFGCRVEFGGELATAEFDARPLSEPVIRDRSDLESFLAKPPDRLLAGRDYGTTVAEQVRRVLDHGLPPLDRVAVRLSMSPATLRRRLAAEGTSFRALKDEVRRDAAIASLAGGNEPIEALAGRLGFSETSAFRRAFKRWTDASPGAYSQGAP